MFSMQFGRIVWKEWRVQRGLCLSCLAMAIVAQVLSVMVVIEEVSRLVAVTTWDHFFTCMYALGCGGVLFAGEREERTADWLHRLPVKPDALLAGKLSFAIVSTLIFQWILAISASALLYRDARIVSGDVRMLFVPSGLLVLIWSILGSLLSRRVLISIFANGCSMLATVLLPFVMTQYFVRSLEAAGMRSSPISQIVAYSSRGDFWACVVVVVIAVVLVIVNLWLARRWCQEKYVDGSVILRFWRRLTGWFKPLGLSRAPKAAALPVSEYEDSWRRTWQRLIWQERRRESAQRVILTAGCLMAILLVLIGSPTPGYSNPVRMEGAISIGMLFLSMIPVTMGVLGFRSDADRQQPRFLINRGVSPASVWLAKQAVWLPRAFWIPAAILFVALITTACVGQVWQIGGYTIQGMSVMVHPLHGDPLRVIWHIVFGLVEFVLLGYCCGQLAAILFQRTIIAFVFAFALNLIAFFYQLIIAYFDMPAWWAVGVPIASLLAITLWQSRAWMLDDQSWRRWRRLSVAIASILVFLVVTLPAYRVAEAMVPMSFAQQWPAFSVGHSDWQSRRTPAEQAVLQQLNSVGRSGWGESAEQADIVVRLMRAPISSLSSSGFEQSWQTRLHYNLRLRSEILLRSGQPAESWECLMTSLKVARCFARDGKFAAWIFGDTEQQNALEQIVRWIGRPELNLAEVDEKRQAVTAELQLFPSISESIVSNYREDRAWMIQSDDFVEALSQQSERGVIHRNEIDLLAIKLPTERRRLDLVLTKLAQISYFSATQLETQGTSDIASLPLPTLMQSVVQTTPLVQHSGWHPEQVLVQYLHRSTVVRAALTRMALISYRKTHSRLPQRLMELSDLVAPAMLIDPNSNHYFEYYPAFVISQTPQRLELHPLSATDVELRQVGRYPSMSIQIKRDQLLSQDPTQIQALQKAIKELGHVFPIPVEAPNQP